jgi:hypothetical protein
VSKNTKYSAIQQIKGIQPATFIKLSKVYTGQEICDIVKAEMSKLELDKDWMLENGFSREMVEDHPRTSEILSATFDNDTGILLIKTEKSLYQAIPVF